MAMQNKTKHRIQVVLIIILLVFVFLGAYLLISSGVGSDLLHFSEKNYVIITTDLPRSELEKLEVKIQKVPLFTNKDEQRNLEWTKVELWSDQGFYHIVLGRGNYRVKATHPEMGSQSTVLKINGTSDVYAIHMGFYVEDVICDLNRSNSCDTSQGIPIPEAAYIWNKHAYMVIDKQENWHDAKALCESMGGHLATITSAGEQRVVAQLVENSGYDRCWLGGYIEDGTWKWVTDEDFEYCHWDRGEPNGESNGMVMHIVHFDVWDDTYPEGQQENGIPIQRFVCEWEIDDPVKETAE